MRRTFLAGFAAVTVLSLTACGGTSTPDVVAEPGASAPATAAESTPSAPAQGIAEGEPNPAAPTPPPTAERPDCSAGDLMVAMVEPAGVPDAVARTYDAIRTAALACDYESLAAIGGDTLTVSFGAVDDPAAYWQRLEKDGATPPPMASLVQLLGGAHATDSNGTIVWPAVHVDRDGEASWQQVAEIYGPEQTEEFRTHGYLGYRVGIAPDGTWQYFVAGD